AEGKEHLDKGLKANEEALAALRALRHDFPNVRAYPFDLAGALSNRHDLLLGAGAPVADAEQALEEAERLLRPLVHGPSPDLACLGRLGRTLYKLAGLKDKQGQVLKARQILEEAISHHTAVWEKDRLNRAYQGDLYSDRLRLCIILLRLKDYQELERV